MPLYHFICPSCDAKLRKILTPEVAEQPRVCMCGEELIRDPHPPSTQAVETIDTGRTPRALTRLADAERLFNERAEIKKRNKLS